MEDYSTHHRNSPDPDIPLDPHLHTVLLSL